MGDTHMSNHKLIVEGWRKFLKESLNDDNFALIYVDYGKQKMLTLYDAANIRKMSRTQMKKYDHYNDYDVVGALQMQESELLVKEPCIPQTYQVNMVFVKDQFRGNKLQKKLMDMAFYIAEKEGFGLTSDHKVGTRPKAAKAWKAIEKSSLYTKQKTSSGSDTFDYNDKTPDPNDDCSMPKTTPATDHSFVKSNNATGELAFSSYSSMHKLTMKKIKENLGESEAVSFENVILRVAIQEFQQAYHGGS
jgi:ribosomal protein S18 acetylase RimI-like enzyme